MIDDERPLIDFENHKVLSEVFPWRIDAAPEMRRCSECGSASQDLSASALTLCQAPPRQSTAGTHASLLRCAPGARERMERTVPTVREDRNHMPHMLRDNAAGDRHLRQLRHISWHPTSGKTGYPGAGNRTRERPERVEHTG